MGKDWTEINFLSGNVKWLTKGFEEDMLQVEYPNNYILDMGWYEGVKKYIIYIIRDFEWRIPVAKYSAGNERDMIELLEKAVEKIEFESHNNKAYSGELWNTEEIEL